MRKQMKRMVCGVALVAGALGVCGVASGSPGVPSKGGFQKGRAGIAKGVGLQGKRVALMAKRAVLPGWKKALRDGYRRSVSLSSWQRRRGIQQLRLAYRLAPGKLEAMVGVSRAYMLLGFANKKKMAHWGERGWTVAKKMIRRWPKRAEGYLWSAIHIGLVAQGGSPMSAFFRQLHVKIEKMAKASIRRNPRLYHGVAQRLLGRFFYKLPWPMRRLKKSRSFLSQAYRLAPYEPNGLLFYGETLKALGQKYYAKRMFKRCVNQPKAQPFSSPAQVPVGAVIAACRKRLKSM